MVLPEVPVSNSEDVQQPPFDGQIFMDSDSEEEVVAEENNGYTLLSQSAVDNQSDIEEGDTSGSEEFLDAEESIPALDPEAEASNIVEHETVNRNPPGTGESSLNQKPNFDVGTSAELRELWSAPAVRADIDLTADKMQAVHEAMSAITLPASAIPEWAASLPEEQWKQQIMDRIQELKTTK